MLFLIIILHQTTTKECLLYHWHRCFLSSFYIKPQLSVITFVMQISCFLSSFYIKPQHMTVVFQSGMRCFLSSFYIKPQPTRAA